MKRLIVLMSVAAFTAVASAATAQWQTTINGASSQGMETSTYMAYFFGGDFDGTEAGLTSALDSAAFAYDGTKLTTGAQTFTADATPINYKIVIVDTVADKYSVLASGSYTPYGAQDPAVAAEVAVTAKNVLGTGTNPVAWTAMGVPEPTSGLLLFLGLAGLALKRKHA